MRSPITLALAMFFTLVPVTLLVPGLHELVVVAHGGSTSDAHAFMTVNMMAGMVTVPFVMRWVRRRGDVRRWVMIALVVDAVAFAGMGLAKSLGGLYAFRVLDGAVHLPAVTLLMVASNRLSGVRRGGSLGALASAIMIGVAIGSPLGGWIVERWAGAVYAVGAVLLLVAAATMASVAPLPPAPVDAGARKTPGRYVWNRTRLQTWIPLGYGFMDRFSIGIFVSTFTLFLSQEHALGASQKGILIALFMLPFAMLCYPAGRLADRIGWFRPMLAGNVLFGLVFASYGLVPRSLLPAVMLLSGVLAALMYAPNLLLISDLAERGEGEGLFGAFQVAGSFGFLVGPIAGGVLVAATTGPDGAPAYAAIFVGVGMLEVCFALLSWVALRGLAREVRITREEETGPPIPSLTTYGSNP
ncbi:MAG: MFS transporter [Gemmatimonadaceae bacterium]